MAPARGGPGEVPAPLQRQTTPDEWPTDAVQHSDNGIDVTPGRAGRPPAVAHRREDVPDLPDLVHGQGDPFGDQHPDQLVHGQAHLIVVQ